MKMTFKKELVMTSEERETIKKIINILDSDDDLDSCVDAYDILVDIAEGDYDALASEYNYYVGIRG